MIPDKNLIEPRFKEAIDRYVQHHVPTGSFTEAVLCNDLKEAIGRADITAIYNLPHIVAYLYNDCPSICWGSRDKVEAWLKSSKEELWIPEITDTLDEDEGGLG